VVQTIIRPVVTGLTVYTPPPPLLTTDVNTVWDTKLQEVQTILRQVVKPVFCMFLDLPDPDPSLFVQIGQN
jgi:hypothetical protein